MVIAAPANPVSLRVFSKDSISCGGYPCDMVNAAGGQPPLGKETMLANLEGIPSLGTYFSLIAPSKLATVFDKFNLQPEFTQFR